MDEPPRYVYFEKGALLSNMSIKRSNNVELHINKKKNTNT